MNETLRIGSIVTTHGIRGELKIFPTTDDVSRYEKLKECIVYIDDKRLLLHPKSVRFFKQFVIIKFEEYDNINDVTHLLKKDLLVDRKDAIQLEEGEYFICDLVGNTVIDREKDEKIGILQDVITTGANNVYLIKKEDGKDLLIPVIEDSEIEHDIENKITRLKILKGLLDL